MVFAEANEFFSASPTIVDSFRSNTSTVRTTRSVTILEVIATFPRTWRLTSPSQRHPNCVIIH